MTTDQLTPEALQASLTQQGVDVNKISIQNNTLEISPPGVPVQKIGDFFRNTLGDIPELNSLLPDSLPVGNVQLSHFKFTPTSDSGPYDVEITLSWPDLEWALIPGILALSHPEITIGVTGGSAYGDVDGDAQVEGVPLHLTLELPTTVLTASLPDTTPAPSAGKLLQSFQVTEPQGNGRANAAIDLGVLSLEALSVLGNIEGSRLLLYMALGHIEFGPGDLATQLTIDYIGGPNSQLSGQVWGQYDIHRKDSDDTLFSIMLLAAYDGPGKSWKFEGGAAGAGGEPVTISDLIEVFTDSADIPGIFNQVDISYLHLAYETGSGDFEFQCDVDVSDLFGAEATVEMIVDVHLHKVGQATGKSAQYAKTFSGRLLFTLADDMVLEFDLLFDQSPHGKATDTTFIAAYKNPSGGELNIGDLIGLVQPDIDVPLSIKLQDAFFIYDKQSGPPARSSYLFGMDIGSGIDLSALPLVGQMLDKDSSLTLGLQPLVALSTPEPASRIYFSEADLTRLGAMIPGGGITLPAADVKAQIGLGINIALGKDTSFHFDLPIKLNTQVQTAATKTLPAAATPIADTPPAGNAPPAPPPTPPAPPPLNQPAEQAITTTIDPMSTSPATTGVTPAPAGSAAGGIQWITIGKGFGPVQINRLGLQFEPARQMVWAYLDAGLSIGPLTFTLDGLGMGTPINKLAPEFRLLGIGIDYKAGPVEIGAAFLRTHVDEVLDANGQVVTPAYDEYSGLATIKTPTIGLSAVGSYSDLPAYKSLFLYAVLNAPLGGPAFFFVTGLAAGFGFNRAVKTPDITAVAQFPLVNMAVSGAGSGPPSGPGERTNYIHDILDQLRGSIYPMNGQYFLAAGIHFTSFELVDSFALLLVSFGKHFEIDVLGLSTVVVPTPLPDGPAVTPVAEVQLALKAVFNPGDGFLSIEAQLTSNSYILDKNCHLTGGFAFYCWFGGPHQGDFVLSLGGFHPNFQKPDHYPTVPRLGLNWQVTPDLSIKGGIYFALTPHMVMAGGRLEALYQGGSLKAWFTLAADFLICWKPYHYDAHAMLDIGVEYTYHLFGTHHINVTVGADVHVWGPDFAGHAHIHLWCVTYDLDFGAATTPKLEPIDWATFRKSFLPEDTGKMVQLSVTAGLLRKEQVDAVEQHVINPRDFQLGIDLVVPYKALQIGTRDVPLQSLRPVTVRGATQFAAFTEQPDGSYAPGAGEDPIATGAFGIAPMARSAGQLTSSLQLTAEMEDANGQWQAANELFSFRPVSKRVPRALWGETLQQDLNGQRYVENVLSGLELIPATPPQPGETQWIAKQALQYSTSPVESGIGFESIKVFTATALGADDSATGYIKAHLTDETTMTNRRQLLAALGFDYDRLGLDLRPSLADALVMEPQIGAFV